MQTDKKGSIAGVIASRRSRLLTRADFISLISRMLFIAIAAYLIFTEVFLLWQVEGMDMFPAIKDGDLAIVFRMQQEYMKDEVVVYSREDGHHIGRIVARGGDVVTIDDSGTLVINGTAQSGEILYPTYAEKGSEIVYPYRVPDGSIFILGDYRTQAEDSREFGPIPMESLEGKIITILRRRKL